MRSLGYPLPGCEIARPAVENNVEYVPAPLTLLLQSLDTAARQGDFSDVKAIGFNAYSWNFHNFQCNG